LKKKSVMILLVMILLAAFSSAAGYEPWPPSTKIFVNPVETTGSYGETFELKIDISNAAHVNAWEIYLRFDPSILTVSNYESGGFLSRAGPAYPLVFSNQSIMGYIQTGELLQDLSETEGNGTLIILSFTVVGGGDCDLALFNTALYDHVLSPLTHSTEDGTFSSPIVTNGIAYTRADGSVDPSNASIQRNGDTYTLTDNIAVDSDHDGIIVERNNMTLNGAGFTIQGNGTRKGILLKGKYNVTIQNVTAKAFEQGIAFFSSNSNTLIGNSITNCSCGVLLNRSSNITLNGSNITENNWIGVRVYFTSGSVLERNNIAGNNNGILLEASGTNGLWENNITASNGYGIGLIRSFNNVILGNSMTANVYDGIYLVSSSNNTIDENNIMATTHDCIFLYASSNNTVKGNYLTDCEFGIVLQASSDNNIFRNNIATSRNSAITLDSSMNNTVTENELTSSSWVGIYLYSSSNNTMIANNMTANGGGIYVDMSSNNSIHGNSMSRNDFGIEFYKSLYNRLCENDIAENQFFGISFYESSSNKALGNNVTGNTYGIGLSLCTSNIIGENNIGMNTNFGIGISESSKNVISNNNFLSNYKQVELWSTELANVWDDGYVSGGNFWSDYSGVDADGDGIGDIPYSIGVNNTDHYPLMAPFSKNDTSVIPVAEFIYSPLDVIAGQTTVIFDATYSQCINGTIIRYFWDFGDGRTAIGKVANHTYDSYGDYEVTLTVVSNSRLSSSQTQSINVKESPVANFTCLPDSNLSVGQSIVFDASGSNPRGGAITTYVWDFGDGNITSTVEPVIIHTYTFPEPFNITLRVLDSEGLNSSSSQIRTVRMPTFLSVSTNPPSSLTGFSVNVTGELHDLYGNGLKDETVVLYYTFAGISTWTPITSVNTDGLGHYIAIWFPPAAGSFTIKTEWNGNSTHFGSSSNVTLSILVHNNQFVFSVESNSTIDGLAFNTTNWELGFTAAGPNGTEGYAKITVSKLLVANISNVEVLIDENECDYVVTSKDDSWLLTFNYVHSSHRIIVDLDTTVVADHLSLHILILLMTAMQFAISVLKRERLKQRLV